MFRALITAVGNLGQDPILRNVEVRGDGRIVTNVTLAVTDRIQDNGVWKDGKTLWVDLGIWGPIGENIVASLRKGDRVIVGGETLAQEDWERDGKSGVNTVLKGSTFVAPDLHFATTVVTKNPKKAAAASSGPASTATVYMVGDVPHIMNAENKLVPVEVASPAVSAPAPAVAESSTEAPY